VEENLNIQPNTQLSNPPSPEASARRGRNLPRDVFLHLFVIVTLYWSAISFITLSWQFINYFLPDVLSYRYYPDLSGPIRFSVASLIIIFPLFILASWYLNKIYRREVVVRDSKVRKWLIYLTLFVASMVIVGDLVTVIYSFLGGDVTIKFILKALSVLIVLGFVFGYYLDDIIRSEPSKLAKYYAWGASVIVLIMVVGAFFIVGSPQKARLVQFDEQKIYDLQNIQGQIVNYYQRKGELPQDLFVLNDSISGYFVPNDSQNGQPYEYIIKDVVNLSFELCANFNLVSDNQLTPKPMMAYPVGGGEYSQNWDHSTGRVCFERKIDKQLYPPIDKQVR